MNFLDVYVVYLLSFCVFLGLVYYYVQPLFLQAIDQYINNIQDQLYDAEKKHQEAEQQLIKSQDKHQEAVLKAEKILKTAHTEGHMMNTIHKQEIQNYEEHQKKLGEEKVARLKGAIIEDVKNKIIEQTIQKSENVFRSHLLS